MSFRVWNLPPISSTSPPPTLSQTQGILTDNFVCQNSHPAMNINVSEAPSISIIFNVRIFHSQPSSQTGKNPVITGTHCCTNMVMMSLMWLLIKWLPWVTGSFSWVSISNVMGGGNTWPSYKNNTTTSHSKYHRGKYFLFSYWTACNFW